MMSMGLKHTPAMVCAMNAVLMSLTIPMFLGASRLPSSYPLQQRRQGCGGPLLSLSLPAWQQSLQLPPPASVPAVPHAQRTCLSTAAADLPHKEYPLEKTKPSSPKVAHVGRHHCGQDGGKAAVEPPHPLRLRNLHEAGKQAGRTCFELRHRAYKAAGGTTSKGPLPGAGRR